MSSAREHYKTLLQKVEDLARKQKATYGEEIRCRVGCFDCCRPPASLFAVEVAPLQEAVKALSPSQKESLKERLLSFQREERELCPLLEDGGCSVYEGRPVICRTQGYALWFREPPPEAQPQEELPEGGGWMNWCAYNFHETKPRKEDAFDVQRLNVMLSLISSLHWPAELTRQSLTELLDEALHDTSSGETHS